MSVHKHNTDINRNPVPSRKAPVPQVDKEHFADMRNLQRKPNHIDSRFTNPAKGTVRVEK